MDNLNELNSRWTRFALASLIVGAVMISFSGVWVKVADVTPNVSAFYRVFFGGLILLLQPSLAFVWDVLFFQRPTTLINWLGVLVALTAIYLGMAGQSASDDRMDGAI